MTAPRWTPEYLNGMRQAGDDLADRTMRVFVEEKSIDTVNQILQNLIHNDDILSAAPQNLPPGSWDALTRYVNESSVLPKWACQAKIKIGEELFADYGMMGFSILGCASLPEAYATAYAATVLGITQQLENHVRRRIYETAQFVVDVMSRGGLKPHGKGIISAQRVRLMHAAIRALILCNPPESSVGVSPKQLGDVFLRLHWSLQDGRPIHQLAMSMAILSFSYVVLRSLQRLGVKPTPEQESSYLHCWNVVGHIMGVDAGLLLNRPETMAEAEALYNCVWPQSVASTVDGAELERALLAYMESFVPYFLVFLRGVPRILTRELVNSGIADALGVKLNWFDRNVVKLLMRTVRGLSHLEERSYKDLPTSRIAAEWMFRLMAKEFLGLARGANRHPFEIPTELKHDKWRLDGVH
jgi:hypothetical protein